jgi:hypothetical protein
MKEKEQVGADIYVDDSPDNVTRLRSKGFYTICFANSTNQKLGEPRAKSWDHVYKLAHEQWASRKATA